jgi:hypothetical protein
VASRNSSSDALLESNITAFLGKRSTSEPRKKPDTATVPV